MTTPTRSLFDGESIELNHRTRSELTHDVTIHATLSPPPPPSLPSQQRYHHPAPRKRITFGQTCCGCCPIPECCLPMKFILGLLNCNGTVSRFNLFLDPNTTAIEHILTFHLLYRHLLYCHLLYRHLLFFPSSLSPSSFFSVFFIAIGLLRQLLKIKKLQSGPFCQKNPMI